MNTGIKNDNYIVTMEANKITLADWEVNITGPWGLTLHQKGAPCLFWRIMQRIILGFRWKRITPKQPCTTP